LVSIVASWNSSKKALVMHVLSHLLIILVFMTFTYVHASLNFNFFHTFIVNVKKWKINKYSAINSWNGKGNMVCILVEPYIGNDQKQKKQNVHKK
jgi:hypothetical protein